MCVICLMTVFGLMRAEFLFGSFKCPGLQNDACVDSPQAAARCPLRTHCAVVILMHNTIINNELQGCYFPVSRQMTVHGMRVVKRSAAPAGHYPCPLWLCHHIKKLTPPRERPRIPGEFLPRHASRWRMTRTARRKIPVTCRPWYP